MQTITKIQDDTYIMKNDELVYKRGYYTGYWLINFLSLAYLLASNSKYKYVYIIFFSIIFLWRNIIFKIF